MLFLCYKRRYTQSDINCPAKTCKKPPTDYAIKLTYLAITTSPIMTILYAVTILHYVFIFQIIISNFNVLIIVQEYVPHNKAFVTITALKSGKKNTVFS